MDFSLKGRPFDRGGVIKVSKGKKGKVNNVVFIGLLLVMVLTAGGVGCSPLELAQASSENSGAFITDRVVEVRIVMKDEDWKACQDNAIAEQYVRADFWFDGELTPDVAVRPKGNSSLREAVMSRSPRFSLKVDFNLLNSARTFRGLKKLNLNNGFSDPTLIRECLAYEIFEQMGIPVPRTSFVDLWVNDTHLGLYTQVEQIDKTFLRRQFPNNSEGNLYKPEMPAAYLNWTETDFEKQQARLVTTQQSELENSWDINMGGGKLSEILKALEQGESEESEDVIPGDGNMPPPGMPPPGMPPGMPPPGILPPGMPPPPGAMPGRQRSFIEAIGLKTNENNPDHRALFRLLDVINNEPDETFPEEIEQVLDVDEALRYLAVSTLIGHLDNYLGIGHNYYLYEIDGRFVIIPWDLNMAFGTFNCGIDREGIINFYIDEPTCGAISERPLVARLLSYQPYLDVYHGYLESLLNGPFALDRMESRIDELADFVRPYVQADKLKFYSTKDFERCLTEDLRVAMPQGGMPMVGANPQFGRMPRGPSAIGLKAFITERSASVRQQLAGRRPSAGDGSGNGGNMRMLGR